MKMVLVLLALLTCQVDLSAAKKKKIIPPVENFEWWRAVDGCKNAKPGDFVNYVARTTSTALVSDDLHLDGLPHTACVAVPLPEIGIEIGWVHQAAGERYYFGWKDGKLIPMFMQKCLNGVVDFVYLPDPVGEKGEPGISVKGDRGDTGPRGERGEPGISVKGDRGDTGPRGERGDPGKVVYLTKKKNWLLPTIIGVGVGAVITGVLLSRGGPQKNLATVVRIGP